MQSLSRNRASDQRNPVRRRPTHGRCAIGQVSDNESFTLHRNSGANDYSIRHHLGSANQDESAPLTGTQLASLRAAARQSQSAFDALIPGNMAAVMSSGAKATLRDMILHLDDLPGSL